MFSSLPIFTKIKKSLCTDSLNDVGSFIIDCKIAIPSTIMVEFYMVSGKAKIMYISFKEKSCTPHEALYVIASKLFMV